MISSLHLCSKCCKLFHGKIRCSKKYRALADTSSLVLHIYSSNGIFHFNSVSIFDRLVYPVFTGPGPISILIKAFKWVYPFQTSLWGGQPRFLHPCHRETQRNQGGVEKNKTAAGRVFFRNTSVAMLFPRLNPNAFLSPLLPSLSSEQYNTYFTMIIRVKSCMSWTTTASQSLSCLYF